MKGCMAIDRQKTETVHWHAVFTASRAEKKVRDRLEELGVECFLPGTDGVEAVDVPEVAGGGAGNCRLGVCAGEPSGTGEGAADEGGGGFSEAEGRGGGCCDSG